MRERTTWDRNEIAKQAAGHAKQADPYTMNQPEHAKAQPASDAYVTGTPSDFAEDVSPGTWQAEYSGGEVKRNEIGMPEFRSETFNHSEKTASEEVLVKKAALCVRIARRVLPKMATENMIEDQALAFMNLPDADLISTYSRLAADDEQQKEEQGQKQAQDQQEQQQTQDEGQKQAGQMPPQFKENAEKKKEEAEAKDQEQGQKQAQDQQQQQTQDEGQKQAGQMPPQFKENAEKKKEEAEAKDQQGQKQATSHVGTALQAMQQGNMKQAEQALQAAVQQMAQQMMQQMAQPQQQAPAMAQQQMAPTSDDQLLDQMLAEGQPGQQQMMSDEIELEAPSMDCGDAGLDPVQDAQLMQLFANQGEAQQAEQAKQASLGVRTASTRTVGARPTAGVSRLGGGVVASAGSRDLSSIWNTSPDVSEVFGIPKS